MPELKTAEYTLENGTVLQLSQITMQRITAMSANAETVPVHTDIVGGKPYANYNHTDYIALKEEIESRNNERWFRFNLRNGIAEIIKYGEGVTPITDQSFIDDAEDDGYNIRKPRHLMLAWLFMHGVSDTLEPYKVVAEIQRLSGLAREDVEKK